MATINDVFSQLTQVSSQLEQLVTALSTLISDQEYANQLAFHHAQQNDTVICNLEKISKQTCLLLNITANPGDGTPPLPAAKPVTKPLTKPEGLIPPLPSPSLCTYTPCPTPPPLPARS